ncbi:hypothetical protein [uncultured Flavobacterium sp.]|uniref:LA_2272 family surface repeat-containing protein n=1 Tax=uncultured Flavobacterium sp. TaxID=165435 RepID=UPI0025D422D0|nr:hypothetical protein [uncultured Flavobacterium sp.]
MKAIICSLLFYCGMAFGQDEPSKAKIFTFTPFAWKTGKVNGVAFGLGHFNWLRPMVRPGKTKEINGLNLEVNPFAPLMLLMFESPFDKPDENVAVRVNGLHLSTIGFDGRVKMNGLAVSLYSKGAGTNGLSVTGTYNCTAKLNGLHIAGITNFSDSSNGVLIAPFNYAEKFNGFEIGVVNQSFSFKGASIGFVNIADVSMTGIQIGLINISGKNKGLQLGLWNKNAKRSLPLINW